MTENSDPIRPAHYRDPNTGRDRIAVWREVLDTYHFQAAIAATVDRYLSRAGRKPGVPAEVDHAKATEVVRRYYEEWGEGAQEELREMLRDLWHSDEAIDALLRDAEKPRTPTPPAAQDDHAAALQRERERADRAERALRLERGAPLLGDLPEGWEGCRSEAYVQHIEFHLGRMGHSVAAIGEAIRMMHEAAAEPRDTKPQADDPAVTPQQAAGARPLPTREQGADDARETALRLERESKCPEATLAALLAGEDATHVDDGSIRSEFERVRAEYREALRRIEQPRGVTPQQAAGARPLPATPRQLVLGNGAVAMHVGTVGDDTHPRMLLLYSVEPGPIGHEDEVGMRPSALPAGASVMPDDPRLDVLIYCGRRESAEMLRDTVQEIIDEWPREEGDDPQDAQDDHAAALQRERERAEAERDEALRALEAERRVLRIEMNAPLLGDIVPPTGMEWRVNGHDVQVLCSAEPSALCRFQACVDNDGRGGWLWWKGGMNMRHTATRVETRAEAIDAAHDAITAQRSDDTARDDDNTTNEGEVTP